MELFSQERLIAIFSLKQHKANFAIIFTGIYASASCLGWAQSQAAPEGHGLHNESASVLIPITEKIKSDLVAKIQLAKDSLSTDDVAIEKQIVEFFESKKSNYPNITTEAWNAVIEAQKIAAKTSSKAVLTTWNTKVDEAAKQAEASIQAINNSAPKGKVFGNYSFRGSQRDPGSPGWTLTKTIDFNNPTSQVTGSAALGLSDLTIAIKPEFAASEIGSITIKLGTELKISGAGILANENETPDQPTNVNSPTTGTGFYPMMKFTAKGDANLELVAKLQFSAGGDFSLKLGHAKGSLEAGTDK